MTETLDRPADTSEAPAFISGSQFLSHAGISAGAPPEDDILTIAYGREAIAVFTAIADRWIVDAESAEHASFYWMFKQLGRSIMLLNDHVGFAYGGTKMDRHRVEVRAVEFYFPHRDGGYYCLELAAKENGHIDGWASRLVRVDGEDELREGPADSEVLKGYLERLWSCLQPGPRRGPAVRA